MQPEQFSNTSQKVTLVDLGLGNLASVHRAFSLTKANVEITNSPQKIASAERLVVPGQGAFRDCAKVLSQTLQEPILEFLQTQKPYLGICLGMQMLFESSEEAPGKKGLGYLEGSVIKFKQDLTDNQTGEKLKVPHMGWNQIQTQHPWLKNQSWFYFVHSYYCAPTNADLTVATTEYGSPFCAAIEKDNIFACQFHPEKSAQAGLQLIEHFLNQ